MKFFLSTPRWRSKVHTPALIQLLPKLNTPWTDLIIPRYYHQLVFYKSTDLPDSKKSFELIPKWNFKDYPSFSLLASKAIKIVSCTTLVRTHSNWLPSASLSTFIHNNWMMDVKVQCQIHNPFIKAAEKLNNIWLNFPSFFSFLFQIWFLSLCIHPPDLWTQEFFFLYTGIACRKVDSQVTTELHVRKTILLGRQ